jgi:hypothetical protein
MILGKYSFGIGDRFCHQGKAQLSALMKAKQQGLDITPVWNKSNREHTIIGTSPADTRKEADEAVKACGWEGPYFVDADHIGLANVDAFIESSDFFTLDVADFITQTADKAAIDAFVRKHKKYVGSLAIDGIDHAFNITEDQVRAIAGEYLPAVRQAGKIYRHVEAIKGGNFITEVSMDETEQPQTPMEMFFILAAIADEGIPAQTIAPKFSGRFNKGVDYVGDVEGFTKEFEEDLAVVAFAIRQFGLPENLKLSVHSGSDKFSIDELCGPYSTVIDINRSRLPGTREVGKWNGERFALTLRHDPLCRYYNPDFRQLLHVAYKIAAEMGTRFLDALDKHSDVIAQNVAENIYERHVRRIFTEFLRASD